MCLALAISRSLLKLTNYPVQNWFVCTFQTKMVHSKILFSEEQFNVTAQRLLFFLLLRHERPQKVHVRNLALLLVVLCFALTNLGF